jgi:amino acid transporter
VSLLKRVLVGRPLPSADEERRRIPKIVGLAVFSSDAISSTAYATEEILHVLVARAGMEALEYLIPISLVVVVLLAIVGLSYRQTIFAYPSGGGSYTVSRENLGTGPSLVAAGSMLTDYILTVAVSISAGVAAITSAVPELRGHRVDLGLVLIALITLANLRGLKEAGTIFAGPTYVYVLSLGGLIVWGLFRSFTGDLEPLPVNEGNLAEFTPESGVLAGVTAFALMRAFSSGAVALTGVEAISIAVPTFRHPAHKNAAKTLVAMVTILGGLFFGISVLAHRLQPTLSEHETILSIMGDAVFGRGSVAYVVLQASTAAILILAANTAYTAFPTMCSIIARDGYLPRQLFNRGDRLVFSNGILVLALAAAALLIGFGGKTNALIPLYAGWQARALVNGAGAVTTGMVLCVVLVSKFTIGAWIPVVLIPSLMLLFRGVHRHYARVAQRLAVPPGWRPPRLNHTVVVLVGGMHRGVLEAMAYARSLAPNHLVAVTVVSDEEEQERIERDWAFHEMRDSLDIIYSPYRELSRPILHFLDEIDARWENAVVTVLIPEVVVRRWWEQLLHNQTALLLKGRLLFRKGVVVTSVPYHLD